VRLGAPRWRGDRVGDAVHGDLGDGELPSQECAGGHVAEDHVGGCDGVEPRAAEVEDVVGGEPQWPDIAGLDGVQRSGALADRHGG